MLKTIRIQNRKNIFLMYLYFFNVFMYYVFSQNKWLVNLVYKNVRPSMDYYPLKLGRKVFNHVL